MHTVRCYSFTCSRLKEVVTSEVSVVGTAHQHAAEVLLAAAAATAVEVARTSFHHQIGLLSGQQGSLIDGISKESLSNWINSVSEGVSF